MDPGKTANEPWQFLDHIQNGTCIIDLWNADSLFHEGSVTVKLKVEFTNNNVIMGRREIGGSGGSRDGLMVSSVWQNGPWLTPTPHVKFSFLSVHYAVPNYRLHYQQQDPGSRYSLISLFPQRLARQGEHGIQSTQVFNVLNNGETVGKIHLRIANIGSVANVYGMWASKTLTCLLK